MTEFMNQIPDAHARIRGIPKYKNINGNVWFYSTYGGTVILAEIYGLPEKGLQMIGNFFGFHIHEGSICSGDVEDPLENTGAHYNPLRTEHPDHVGDLVPLLSVGEKAWSAFYTGRFYPEDVVGRTIVIHDMPDDFHTQPAGNSGEKIACGIIEEHMILPDSRTGR